MRDHSMTARRFYLAIVLPAIILLLAFAAVAMANGNLSPSAARHAPMMAVSPAHAESRATGANAMAVSTAGNAIVIRNFAFEPAMLTIVAGSKVVWTNRDEEPHLVVSAGAQFPASPA